MTNEFQNKLTKFWSDFDKSDFVSKVNCAELAGIIIQELEDRVSVLTDALSNLNVTIDSENVKHSDAVMMAIRKARNVLKEVAQHG
jgi:hypothetical protein